MIAGRPNCNSYLRGALVRVRPKHSINAIKGGSVRRSQPISSTTFIARVPLRAGYLWLNNSVQSPGSMDVECALSFGSLFGFWSPPFNVNEETCPIHQVVQVALPEGNWCPQVEGIVFYLYLPSMHLFQQKVDQIIAYRGGWITEVDVS